VAAGPVRGRWMVWVRGGAGLATRWELAPAASGRARRWTTPSRLARRRSAVAARWVLRGRRWLCTSADRAQEELRCTGAPRAQEELRCAVRRIYPRGSRAGVKEAAGLGSERLCVGGSAASAAWPCAGMCGSLVAVAWALRRRFTREGLHGCGFGTPG